MDRSSTLPTYPLSLFIRPEKKIQDARREGVKIGVLSLVIFLAISLIFTLMGGESIVSFLTSTTDPQYS